MSEDEILQDCPLFSSDNEGFYFFVPRRFVWQLLKDVMNDPLSGLKYVPCDEWKLKKGE